MPVSDGDGRAPVEPGPAVRALVELTQTAGLAPEAIAVPPLPAIPSAGRAGGVTDLVESAGEARLAQFVVEVLRSLALTPGLIEVGARASAFSRSAGHERMWVRVPGPAAPAVSLGGGSEDEEDGGGAAQDDLEAVLARALDDGARVPTGPVPVGGGRFALVRAIGAQRRAARRQGYLVALFDGPERARDAEHSLSTRRDDLALGLLLRRQAADAGSLVELSAALAESGGERDAIRRGIAIVKARTRSDGAEVLALRRTPFGPRIERVGDDSDRARWGISRDRGHADWVVLHDDWLLIDEPAATRRGREPDRGVSGRHGEVAVVTRARAVEAGGEVEPDRTLLVVPLRLHGRCLGALSVWRSTDEPYDPEVDRAALEHLGQQIAFGVRWLVHGETMRRAHEEIVRLEHSVAEGSSPGSFYREVAAASARLARAARGILLLHEGGGRFYTVGDWIAAEREGGESEPARFQIRCTGPQAGWLPQLLDALREMPGLREHAGRRFVLRACLPLARGPSGPDTSGPVSAATSPSPPSGDAAKPATPPAGSTASVARRSAQGGALVLLDREPLEHEQVAAFDDALAGEAVRSLLDQSAPVVLQNHPRAFAKLVSEELGEPPEASRAASREVLRRAADLLHDRLRADAVLVYEMEAGGAVVRYAAPDCEQVVGLAAVPGSLTEQSIEEAIPLRVLDAGDDSDPLKHRMDLPSLQRLARAFGWSGVRSWLCHPVMHDDRCLGVIKVLTRSDGEYLGATAHEAVAAVAARAGGALQWLQRAAMLDSLNRISVELSGFEGNRLAREIAVRLEEWARLYLQRRCHVALVASVNQPRPHLYAACAHIDQRAFDTDNRHELDVFFARWNRRPPQGEPPPPPSLSVRGTLTATDRFLLPIGAAGHKTLVGWLLLVGEEPFGPGDRAIAAEAAREASFFLLQAHRRYIWSHQLASFRHAVIGPVQGLASAAQELSYLASTAGVDPAALEELRARVEGETEAVRLCWENERIYTTGGSMRVVKRPQALRPLIEKCAHRFEAVLAARGIELRLDWPGPGSLVFPFDAPAIDVVLSNLLDNARKYSFYNQPVVVSVSNDGQFVRITVENIGHPIPARLQRSIYRVGERLDWQDPIRSIDGTGLGLPMARALVKAHEGRIRHTSVPVGGGYVEKTPPADAGEPEPVDAEGRRIGPHRVTFEVLLPHHWAKGKGAG